MINLNNQYINLVEGRITKIQFLRNARMMYPQYINGMTSYNDTINILTRKRVISESILPSEFAPEMIGGDFLGGKIKSVNISSDRRFCSVITDGRSEVISYNGGNDKFYTDRGRGIDTLPIDEASANVLLYLANKINPQSQTSLSDFNLETENRLNELSPTTYQSAADKAYGNGQEERYNKFQQGVSNSFPLPNVVINGKSYKVDKVQIENPRSELKTFEIQLEGNAYIVGTVQGIAFHDVKTTSMLTGDKKNGSVDKNTSLGLMKWYNQLFKDKPLRSNPFIISSNVNESKQKRTVDNVNSFEVQLGLRDENGGKDLVSQEEFNKALKKVLTKLTDDQGYYTKKLANYKEPKVTDGKMKEVKVKTVSENLRTTINNLIQDSARQIIEKELNKIK